MLEPSIFTAVASAPVAQQESGELIYLYAILPAGALGALPATSIDAARPVFTLSNGQVQAVVSRVQAAAFQRAVIERSLQDLAWLERHVRTHQNVLNQLVATGLPVLPMRFCTIYASEAAIQTLLEVYKGLLLAELARLQQKQEWGVKLYMNDEMLCAAILDRHPTLARWGEEAEIEALQARVASTSTGAGFLLKKKLALGVHQRASAISQAILTLSHHRLSGQAVEAVLNPLYQQDDELRLNAAYLVATTMLDVFQGELARLAAEYGPIGVRYEQSGPWPAYNFLNLELDDARNERNN